jgi:hypothetical protein
MPKPAAQALAQKAKGEGLKHNSHYLKVNRLSAREFITQAINPKLP